MKKILALLAFLLIPAAAQAQSTGRVVVDCTIGVALAYPVGTTSMMSMLPTGSACVSAAVSASISGFPTIQSTGTPISVTTGGVTGTLPSGTVVVASNVGATNGAYCKLGASASVNDQLIPPNSWFAFTVGANTQLSCITSTSTTTVNMVGGSGLPTGSGGGGGGGGGGGAVTVADGADVTQGANADAVVAAGAAGTLSAKLRRLTTDINTLLGAIAAKGEGATGAAVPSGAQYMGINVGGNLTGWTGAVTAASGGFASGALAAGAGTDGWDATQGAKADAACGTGSGTCSMVALVKFLNGLAAAATPVTDQVGGAVTALNGDPCQTTAKTTVAFTLATAAVKVAITGVSAKKIYVCAYELNNNAADSVAIFEATTGTTCATAAAALIGAGTSVATAATGYNFAANGGITRGNGAAQVLATLTNAADLCIAQSAATQLSGSFTYAVR